MPKMDTMLKLNFLRGKAQHRYRSVKVKLCWVLGLVFACQIYACWQHWMAQRETAAEMEQVQKRIGSLDERRRQLKAIGDLESVYAAIRDRNSWIERKAKSPLPLLERFESNVSGSIEFKSIETDGKHGSIKLAAPDMDTAARFLNASLGNANVRITADERIRDGVIVIGSWNE